ncbi:NADPH:quinone reductase [Catalinimonas alkaloidigena]|uniref:NADPH:quinone reductase n=1 Tax=Catalinimonas alkaloidigena TaxID=1075417 RepID=A0A1G9FAI1_9BACT|nr:NAD(P)-dependent alcohol dehydrogenase [Catalinimonas alkaloidigena]SDK85243.1 NADPH:quinone reductase [Catalinimonas alkaloidigena]
MKAVTYQTYGAPEVLQLAEVETPTPQDHEVLIRIHATTVTAGDWRMRKGDPFAIRLFSGLTAPKHPILGHELAGEVEATGKAVTRFKKGDWVFGSTGLQSGTYAEYITLPEDGTLALKPKHLTCEQAAAVPVGALTALHFLRKAQIRRGANVLIHGASGAVGTAAVQLAKAYGATVTGVCSTANLELVRSLGADRVIDYTTTDFTTLPDAYDIIFSTVGKTSYTQCRHLLTDQGVYVASEAAPSDYFHMVWAPLVSRRKVVAGVAKGRQENLRFIKQQLEAGTLRPAIDRRYALTQLAEAHRYVEQGHKKGNVVITVHAD